MRLGRITVLLSARLMLRFWTVMQPQPKCGASGLPASVFRARTTVKGAFFDGIVEKIAAIVEHLRIAHNFNLVRERKNVELQSS